MSPKDAESRPLMGMVLFQHACFPNSCIEENLSYKETLCFMESKDSNFLPEETELEKLEFKPLESWRLLCSMIWNTHIPQASH